MTDYSKLHRDLERLKQYVDATKPRPDQFANAMALCAPSVSSFTKLLADAERKKSEFERLRIPVPVNRAKEACKRIAREISDFERLLRPDQEVGASLVATAEGGVFHFHDLGFTGPELVVLSGTSGDGSPIRQIMHIGQINLTLKALPVHREPNRIGFVLMERFK